MRKIKTKYLWPVLILSILWNAYMMNKIVRLETYSIDGTAILENPPIEIKQRQTVMVIDALLLQINLYASLKGKPPENIDLLQSPLDGDGPNRPKDCFGNRLMYFVEPDEMKVVSSGVDGVFGTEDDIIGRISCNGLSREIASPIGNWFAETLCYEQEDEGI